MDQVRLGDSGLRVSRIVLGCMSFGDPGRGTHPWTLPAEQARELIVRALEAGITTFDTANVYSDGSSEEILGHVLGQVARREEVVVATKVHGRMGPGPNGGGLSRGAILTQVDASLRRLGTDYVDLLQIHRYDPRTPVEETLEALHDVVRAGKARYLGASSMHAWQLVEAQHVADAGGWTRFVSMQDQYNLLMREEEREMLPYCAHAGLGVLPWSPLARGRLARGWDEETARSRTDRFGSELYHQAVDPDRRVVDAVGAVAAERGVPRAQVALAWLLGKPVVTAPIVGATRLAQLDDAIGALDLQLSEDEVARLEEHYVPHRPEGY